MDSQKSPSAPKNKPPISVFWVLSIGVHALLLFAAGWTLVQGPEFSITNGHGGQMEVDLSAGAQPAAPDSESFPKDHASDPAETVTKTQSAPSTSPSSGNNPVSGAKQGGDTGQSRLMGPDYLQNPSPVYPEKAKSRGQEGVVVLHVVLSDEGLPTQVSVKKSSGFYLLDDAALKAVRKWKFKPAKVGSFSKEAEVDIPLRFRLEESR